MKISLGIYPNETPADIIASAKLADEMGYSTLWVLDSHLLFHEVYTLLGALAVSTTRVRLGTAVTNPLTRHPTVTAAAFSTLAELSGGRASLGISVGDSALKSMNLQTAKMSVLAETVALCRKLLAARQLHSAKARRPNSIISDLPYLSMLRPPVQRCWSWQEGWPTASS